ncbi:MAG TPA: RIP metalloprotease RseP [Candidatus Omnitrophota bacterium]|nr:RIP metalloprotease RseP [Candidatus Omnitrophota bacterium]
MNHLPQILNFLISILPALIVFGVLIIVHEWGHFIACRLSKVRVEKFSIGFGPELFHWQSKETRFSLSILPLGGFVSPAGEEASKVGPEGPKPGDFLAASTLSRIFIIASGVLMNYVLAFVVFWCVLMIGQPVPGTVVGGFVKGYSAENSFLRVNDKILKVNDQSVTTFKDILDQLNNAQTEMIKLNVERPQTNGTPEFLIIQIKPKVETVTDVFGKKGQLKRMGIMPDGKAVVYERYEPFPALKKAWELEVFHTVLTHKAIFYLITGQLSTKNLMGPLGIIQISGQAAKAGIVTLLQLLAILSISLAVINLLPFPALDGGHLIFLLIELVTGKRISPVVQEKITTVGFFLLMALMVFVIYNDLDNMRVIDGIKNAYQFVVGEIGKFYALVQNTHS